MTEAYERGKNALARSLERRKARADKRKVLGFPVRAKRKIIVASLDTLFSFVVRLRDKDVAGGRCVFDCQRPIECCFHFVTRSKYSVRWDLKNAVGSCHPHNYEMEFNPHPFIQWYIKTRGIAAYEDLLRRSNQIAKFSNEKLIEIRENLRHGVERHG